MHHALMLSCDWCASGYLQLLQSVSHKPIDAEISDALTDHNKPKNRSEKYIPCKLRYPIVSDYFVPYVVVIII